MSRIQINILQEKECVKLVTYQNQIRDDEMGRACNKKGGKKKCIQVRGKCCGILKERGHVEDLGVGDSIILK